MNSYLNPQSAIRNPKSAIRNSPRRSADAALVHDFFRKGRMHLLSLLAIPVWPLLLYLVMKSTAQVETRELRFIFFMTMMMEALFFVAMIGVSQADISSVTLHGGFPRRLYTLPLTTARLVAWQLLPAIGTIALTHCYAAGFIRALTGVMPPLLGPILFLIMFYTGVMVVIWGLPGFVVLRLIILVAAAWYPGYWFLDTYAYRSHLPAGVVWAAPAPASFIWMPLATLAAYGLAVWGVARDRRGEAWSLATLKTAWGALFDRAPHCRRLFASPQAAQFWFELRQKGWIMPTGALLIVTTTGPVVYFCNSNNSIDNVLLALCGLPFFLIPPLSVIAGIFMGRNNLAHVSENGLDLFRATRPASDAALSSAMHKVALFNILTSAAICVAAPLALTACMALVGNGETACQVWQYWVKDFDMKELGLWFYPLALALVMLVSWVILSLATALGQAGHGKLMARVVGCGMGMVIGTIFAQFWLPAQVTLGIVHAVLIAFGAAFLLGGGGAILACWRRRRTAPLAAGLSFLSWLGLLGIGVWAMTGVDLHSLRAVQFFWLGVLTLPPATPFMGVLALGWNRHR